VGDSAACATQDGDDFPSYRVGWDGYLYPWTPAAPGSRHTS